MKYFIGNGLSRTGDDAIASLVTLEVSVKYAKDLYLIWGEHNEWHGDNLEQYPLALWKAGDLVSMRNYDLWGEDVSDNVLFKRRLNGSLGKGAVK